MTSSAPSKPSRLRRGFIFSALFGALLLRALPLSLSPGIPSGEISFVIRIDFPGSFEEEVERTLAIPLENALSHIPGILNMVSSSQRDRLQMHLLFSSRFDEIEAYQQLRERLFSLEPQFPPGARRPQISRSDPRDRPVFVAAFSPEKAPPIEKLRNLFEAQEGVGEVLISGGLRREIRIMLDPAEGRFFFPLAKALDDAGTFGNFGPPGKTPLRMARPPQDLEAVKRVRISSTTMVKDIAAVDYFAVQQNGSARLDGKEVIILSVRAEGNTDLGRLSSRLRSLMSDLPGVVVLHDQGELLRKELRQLCWTALGTWATLIILMALILDCLRSALLLALNLPFSSLAALAALSVFKHSPEFTSLSGIILGSGLVSAAGVLFMQSPRNRQECLGLSAALTGSAFFPLFFSPPELILPFSGLALATTVQNFASLVYLFFFLRPFLDDSKAVKSSRRILLCELGEKRLCKKSPFPEMGNKTAASVLFLFPCLSLLLGLQGTPLLQERRTKTGFLSFTIECESGTPLTKTEAIGLPLEKELGELPGIRRVWSSYEGERLSFDLELEDPSRRGELQRGVEQICRPIPEGFLYFPEELEGLDSYEVLLTGPDLKLLRQAAQELAAKTSLLPGVRGNLLHFKDLVPGRIIQLDPILAMSLDVIPAEAAERLYWALSGPVAEKLFIPKALEGTGAGPGFQEIPVQEEEMDLRISADPAAFESIADLLLFPLPLQGGGTTQVQDLACITEEAQTGRITRTNRSRSLSFTVLCQRGGGSTGRIRKLRKMTRELIAEHPFPPGLTALVAENRRRRESALEDLMGAFFLALPLALLILVFYYEDLKVPLCFFVQLPFCISAALLPSLLRGDAFSAPLALGAILVLGPLGLLNLSDRPGTLGLLVLAAPLPLLFLNNEALILVQAFTAGTAASPLSFFLAKAAFSSPTIKKTAPLQGR